ncbi:MAG: SUMF1/EgtB/PvdO family nonheme iron enzyme, partial [Acidobacteria bacterium]|nr:SUMF1/EgtB/PvdO family nonheme iron enzyme [Acidobacteriota bacterium]
SQMKELIRQFGLKLRQGGVGVFYFAGHGLQVNGRNYLMPIGAEITAAAEVEYEAVEAGFVLAQMEEARNRLNVVILDACRNNPYARGFRSGTGGLASVSNAPSGTLIAYATAADDVASDGSGSRNGLFTGELLAQLKQPGLTLEQVFRRTRTAVRGKSGGKQVPYEYSSVEGEDFYFLPPVPVAGSDEERAWDFAKRSRSVAAVRLYLSDYPNSRRATEARRLLAELEKNERLVVGNPPTKPPVSNPAPSVRMSATGVALTALASFTTVKTDRTGMVIERKLQQECWGYVEDLGNGVKLELVELPTGEFQMGADDGGVYERPLHQVQVKGFLMGKYEVTQAQWRAVAKLPKIKIGLIPEPPIFKGENFPMYNVNWDEAMEFCARLSRKTGGKYSLPSEAQWEYAARAGTATPFAFGPTITPELASYNGMLLIQGEVGDREPLTSVGSFPANAWGLFDMHGNMWEWCADEWHLDYISAPSDGRVWGDISSSGSQRVIRGGGWYSQAAGDLRSSVREQADPGGPNPVVGFRVVRQ